MNLKDAVCKLALSFLIAVTVAPISTSFAAAANEQLLNGLKGKTLVFRHQDKPMSYVSVIYVKAADQVHYANGFAVISPDEKVVPSQFRSFKRAKRSRLIVRNSVLSKSEVVYWGRRGSVGQAGENGCATTQVISSARRYNGDRFNLENGYDGKIFVDLH